MAALPPARPLLSRPSRGSRLLLRQKSSLDNGDATVLTEGLAADRLHSKWGNGAADSKSAAARLSGAMGRLTASVELNHSGHVGYCRSKLMEEAQTTALDGEMYDPDMIDVRCALRYQREVRAALMAFNVTLSKELTRLQNTVIDEAMYTRFFKLIYRALMPFYDEADASEVIAEDWLAERGHEEGLDLEAMADA
eukprot:7138791-Prymnesium_polylepis.1